MDLAETPATSFSQTSLEVESPVSFANGSCCGLQSNSCDKSQGTQVSKEPNDWPLNGEAKVFDLRARPK